MALRQRLRRFLQRPGSVDVRTYEALLPEIERVGESIADYSDDELTEAAGEVGTDRVRLCALAREAATRGLGERPYDEQLLGALAMLDGHVAEMATGEGKTLSAAIAAAGFVATGRRVQVLTVNDYLAARDAGWMAPVYRLLGVSVGQVQEVSSPAQRHAAYAADVLYGAVHEVGFDVLRDSLAAEPDDQVGATPDVAIVDEADSVLVDEARVPLVLAGSAGDAAAEHTRHEVAVLVAGLRPQEHYESSADGRTVHLSTTGTALLERELGEINLYAEEHLGTLAMVNVALYAHVLLRRDVDYIVTDGRARLVSESRGRVASRQRWPDGLQEAVEAKEALSGTGSGEVLTSITMQALLGRYQTVAGMTGTALAVAEAMREFYRLEVAVIPPHRPCVRIDEPDRIFPTRVERDEALLDAIAELHAAGRPVLVGTQDVAASQRLARRLAERELAVTVLNAKNDAAEAGIIAEAGRAGAITVSTQMAGRGTDIRLGGRAGDRSEVADSGGLQVLASERYWTSRLDDQLRGRAGRQGDPGGSQIFASAEDALIEQYVPGESGRAGAADLDHAQRVAEGVQLEIHRNTWRYSRLVEHQRQLVVRHREELLHDPQPRQRFAPCERLAELAETVEADALDTAARAISLHTLDRAWADHLAYLDELREGIHLHAIARQDPLDEFHRAAIAAFTPLLDRAAAAADELFEALPVVDGAPAVTEIGVRRPTATWTYVVHDNPAGTEIERALQSVTAALRRRRH